MLRRELIRLTLLLVLGLVMALPGTAGAATAWVTSDNNLTPVDTATGTAGTPIPIPGNDALRDIALSPDGRYAYLVNNAPARLIRVDLVNRTVDPPIAQPDPTPEVAVSPDGTKVYVLTSLDGIRVYDAATMTALPTVNAHGVGFGLAISPDGGTAFVSVGDNNATEEEYHGLIAIDLADDTQVDYLVDFNGLMGGVAVTPDGSRVYTVTLCCGTARGYNLETATEIPSFSAGTQSQFIAINPRRDQAYVTNFSQDESNILDLGTNSKLTTLDLTPSLYPQGVAVSPDGLRALIAARDTDEGVFLNLEATTPTVVPTRVTLPDEPGQPAFVPNQPPTAALSVTTARPLAGRPVTLDASASADPEGGAVTEYRWDFGDGTTLVTDQPVTQHTYAAQGQFSPKVQTVDALGCATGAVVYTGQTASCGGGPAGEATRQITVGPPPSTLGALTVTVRKKKVKAGGKATFRIAIPNSGPGPTTNLKICASGPKGAVRTPCRDLAAVAPGQTANTRFKAKVSKKAKPGKKIKLTFTATADDSPPQTATGRVRVKS